jgi:hypothetical protein
MIGCFSRKAGVMEPFFSAWCPDVPNPAKRDKGQPDSWDQNFCERNFVKTSIKGILSFFS